MTKVITEPRVYLVGAQSVNIPGLDNFLNDHEVSEWSTDSMSPGETLAESAGRLCYMSFAKPRPGGNKAYLGHILESGHGSVLEHAVYSMIFTGVSRSLTHELVRHRAGFGYSQLSQRYVDESNVDIVCPPLYVEGKRYHENFQSIYDGLDMDSRAAAVDLDRRMVVRRLYSDWFDDARRAIYIYGKMARNSESILLDIEDKTARRKAAREAARSVLPNCTETKIFVTGNARAWRHFLELRGSAAADAEIRRLAVAVSRVLKKAAPNIFGDFVESTCELSGEQITPKYRKV